jgi:hypothetical protein
VARAVARHDAVAAQQAAAELRQAYPAGEGAPAPRLGRLAGAIALPAADDLRRIVRRAAWPPTMLRGLGVRLRDAWAEQGRVRKPQLSGGMEDRREAPRNCGDPLTTP